MQHIYREFLKKNLDAIVAPGVTDDASKCYSVGSMWVDITADNIYFCLDNTVGSAVWGDASGIADGVTFTPAGDIEATNVQDAIEELDTEKVKRIVSVDNEIARFDSTGGDIQGYSSDAPTISDDGKASFLNEVKVANNKWAKGTNYAGTDVVNLLKVNVDDEIDVGGTMNMGTIEAPEDGGAITLFDMPVSATPADGNEQSVTMKLDGDNMFKLYSEADSAGGVDTHQFQPLKPMVYAQAVQVLTGAGAVDIVTQITHIVTNGVNALTLVDGAEGQEKFIVMKTDVNTGTLTPSNLGNGTTITFDDVGDSAHLLFTNGSWHFMGGTATLA